MMTRLAPLTDALSDYLAAHHDARRRLFVLREIAAVAILVVFAFWRFWTPADFAANLPREAAKYGVATWNLYQTGRYEFVINHHAHPGMGGLGYALLILPSLWLTGGPLDKTIYTQLVLAVLTCVGVYVAVRQCFGVGAGFLAGLGLTTYRRFDECTRMLDTSIPSAFFFVAGALVFLWILQDARRQSVKWLFWGLCAGWATAIRSGDAVVYAILTLFLLWRLRSNRKEICQRLLAAAVGAAPLILPMLWYNHVHCGAWLRDARAYWCSNPYDNLSRMFGWRFAFQASTVGEELKDHGNLFFYLQLLATHLTSWPYLASNYSRLGSVLVFTLTGATLCGIWFALQRARVQTRVGDLLWFAGIVTGVVLMFYSVFCFRVARFLVPVAPFCAAFLGIGIVETVRRLWQRQATKLLIPVLALLWIIPARESVSHPTVRTGDQLPVASLLKEVDARVEPNAVIITSTGPWLIEYYVIRNTARQLVPLNHKHESQVQPGPPKDPRKIPPFIAQSYDGDRENGAVDIFEFSAVEDPDRIQQLLDAGLPVYVIDTTFSEEAIDDLRSLSAHFDVHPLRKVSLQGSLAPFFPRPVVCVWKLTSRPAGSN
jgi:hypothetical protein